VTTPVIAVTGLRKAYGQVVALDEVSFTAPAGSVLGLLGHPMGPARPPRSRSCPPPSAQNLALIGRLSRLPRRAARGRAAELLDRFGLTAAADRLVRTYSGGMRRRLDAAAALAHRPPVLGGRMRAGAARHGDQHILRHRLGRDRWGAPRSAGAGARPGLGNGARADPRRCVPRPYRRHVGITTGPACLYTARRRMSAVTVPARCPGRAAMAVTDTLDVAGRNPRSLWRTPLALVFAAVQPVIFVLLFRYAFGGVIHVPGIPHVDYLMPGIFAQAVAFGAIGTAVGLSADLRSGILTRFRTLPMSLTAVLGGRTVADLARNVVVVAVMTGVGFAVGFRPSNGAAGLLAALGLVTVFAYALSWAFVALGLHMSDPEAAQAAGVPVMFLLVFTSDAFVPLQSMPGWLQAAGAHQPVTALVNAERDLILGGPAAGAVAASLAWSVGILALFAAIAALTYWHMDR